MHTLIHFLIGGANSPLSHASHATAIILTAPPRGARASAAARSAAAVPDDDDVVVVVVVVFIIIPGGEIPLAQPRVLAAGHQPRSPPVIVVYPAEVAYASPVTALQMKQGDNAIGVDSE